MHFSNISKRALLAICSLVLLASCIHKKYETPITKNTQQPDKVLFDQAIKDIEHGRYEVARLSLNTLMNTYETSEYLAKAKLAIADSWYREGGASGLAQAEGEYKDFILFYPGMPEAAEAQNRVCDIHYGQMDQSDRDITQTVKAEDECRQVLVQFPNSKFAPLAAQKLRNIQESLAQHEFWVGNFYWKRDMNPAAANRLEALVDQYPLYSRADEALYEAGDAYSKMGPRFRARAGEMFTRIVRDYPLGARTADAKARLQDLEFPVPQPDPKAVARMKYEQENYKGRSMYVRATSMFRSSPDVTHAAKEGAPTMTDPKRTIPVSIPVNTDIAGSGAGTGASGTTEVTASTGSASGALDAKADARQAQTANGTPAPASPLPTNRDKQLAQMAKARQKKQAQIDKKNAELEKKAAKKKKPTPDTSTAPQNTATPANPATQQTSAGQTGGATAAVPASSPAGQNPQQ